MITTADALDVMHAVTHAHPRTAPRWHDDPEAARASARIWSAMFNRHNLAKDDLIDAVIRRAADQPNTAPEPGEIIAVARAIRAERSAREQAVPELRAKREATIDRKIADYAGQFGITS